MDIRHGTLLNVYGTPVVHDGYTIVPADVRLDGTSFGLSHLLRDHPGAMTSIALRPMIKELYEAAWVYARIPRVFGFMPEPSEIEKSLLDVGFVAVSVEGRVGYPFVCSDHYGKAGLMFSDDGPSAETQRAVAASFWDLLMRDIDDLADFEERVYHPGAGVWMDYGCKYGHVYCEVSEG